MPIGIKFSNFAFSTLAVGCNTTATSLALASGTGAKFPTLAAGEYFYATLENASLDREVVKVTARSTDTITVVRGQDNTTARSWNAGDSIALRLNAGALNDFKTEVVDATNLIRTSNNTFTGANTFSTAPAFGTPLAIASGGTGASTAATAFDNLKQAATYAYAGTVKLASGTEVRTGTDNTRAMTVASFRDGSIVTGTPVSVSGTAVDFTSIPSWAKRLTLCLIGVSTSGTSPIILQLGTAATWETSGYIGATFTGPGTGAAYSSSFQITLAETAADLHHGVVRLERCGNSLWSMTHTIAQSNAVTIRYGAGTKSLSDVLTRLRLTTVAGTATFDAGTATLSWE